MNQVFFPIISEEERQLPFYVKSVGIQKDQEDVIRPKGYPDFHWIHVTKGKGRVIIDGEEMLIGENMGFFIYPGVKHSYYGVEKRWETHWLTFDGYAISKLLEEIGLQKSGPFYVNKGQILEEHFLNILGAVSGNSTMNGFQTSVYLYEFLINCKSCINESPKTGSDRQGQLRPVIEFMRDGFAENLSLEEMAKVINVTPHHLCRLFMEILNMRPFEYLTKIRMKKAKEIMSSATNPSIKAVAKQTGYNDVSYFCAVFKKYEGVTPGEFKRSHLR